MAFTFYAIDFKTENAEAVCSIQPADPLRDPATRLFPNLPREANDGEEEDDGKKLEIHLAEDFFHCLKF